MRYNDEEMLQIPFLKEPSVALRINIPEITGVPAEIISALENLNSLHPGLWEDNWVSSLIEGPNEYWELKLADKNGITKRGIIFPEQQNSTAVCASLLILRTVQIPD
jgi:hypothetical protein